jgi:hypothetical protein
MKTNKSKQNRLHLLAFIRPNRDFSTGYGRKNKKIVLSLHSRMRLQTRHIKKPPACVSFQTSSLAPSAGRFGQRQHR